MCREIGRKNPQKNAECRSAAVGSAGGRQFFFLYFQAAGGAAAVLPAGLGVAAKGRLSGAGAGGTGEYVRTEHGDNAFSWVAYVFATRTPTE